MQSVSALPLRFLRLGGEKILTNMPRSLTIAVFLILLTTSTHAQQQDGPPQEAGPFRPPELVELINVSSG